MTKGFKFLNFPLYALRLKNTFPLIKIDAQFDIILTKYM